MSRLALCRGATLSSATYIDTKFRFITDTGTVYTLERTTAIAGVQWTGWEAATSDLTLTAQNETEEIIKRAGYNINDFSDGVYVLTTTGSKNSMFCAISWTRIFTMKIFDDNTYVMTDVMTITGKRLQSNVWHYYNNQVSEAYALTGTAVDRNYQTYNMSSSPDIC